MENKGKKKPFDVRCSCNLTKEEHEVLRWISYQTNKPISQILQLTLREYIKNHNIELGKSFKVE